MSAEAPKFSDTAQALATLEADKATHRQEHFRRIFQKGEYELYAKHEPIKFDAFNEAFGELFSRPGEFVHNFGDHVRKIDYEFRGGRDIGGAEERMERVAALTGVIALFTAFDFATSKPFEKLFPIVKPEKIHTDGGILVKELSPEIIRNNAKWEAVKKILEVMNDKYATALGNMGVEKLTGKRGFVHEVADKGADTLNVGYTFMEDFVNGPTLESAQRILFQIPIAGALLEQGLTRLSMLQERTPIHTATGKMLYMAMGVFIRLNREAAGKEKDMNAGDAARLIAIAS